MDFRRSFALGLAWRVALAGAGLAALAYLLDRSGMAAATIVAMLAVAGAFGSLWRHVTRTNQEIARFLEALRFGDFSQRFASAGHGSGFDQLAGVLDDAIRRLGEDRGRLSEEARYHLALLDEAPTALLTIDEGQRVGLANKAARTMFEGRDHVPAASFAPWGEEFVAALTHGRPGRQLITLIADQMPQRTTLSIAQVSRLGASLRIVAIQPIQRELASAELAAQTDLVRVLTHEIMNSLTPVTSLAETAADLMDRIEGDAYPAVADARAAVRTLARRADGLLRFVESYQSFSRTPVVERRRFDAADWAGELRQLFHAAEYARGVTLQLAVPPGVMLDGDPALLCQATINLLKNAAQAARMGNSGAQVCLTITRSPRGRDMILVDDSGPGIVEGLESDIFLPFFTTKAAGSGVGLSLARQIVVAHGGSIRASRSGMGGASFQINL